MGILQRSSSRDGYAVRVLAVHTSEGIDKPVVDDAAALRDASWWEGSSHAIADDDPGSLLTPAEGCVPYERASWTLRSGNRWSENIELIAQAGWTRAQWLARPKLLDNCARWLADRSTARNIPLVKLTPAEYRAGKWGVIGHHDHTVGYSDGTHWDPGPGFPWDVVLAKANAYRNGTSNPGGIPMPLDQETANEISRIVKAWSPWAINSPSIDWGSGRVVSVAQQTADNAKAIAAVSGQIAGLTEAVKALAAGGGVDLEQIEDAAKRGTEEALSGFEATVTVSAGADEPPA